MHNIQVEDTYLLVTLREREYQASLNVNLISEPLIEAVSLIVSLRFKIIIVLSL